MPNRLKVNLLAVLFVCALAGTGWALDYNSSSWMSNLDGSLNYTQISIPGTHDSAADYEHCMDNSAIAPIVALVSTQTYDIKDQLDKGIRYLDLRLGYEDVNGEWKFKCNHNVYFLKQYFSDIVDDARLFLIDHPSEFLIFMIKQEGSSQPSSTFWKALNEDVFDNYKDSSGNNTLFFLDKRVPTIDEVRGKIIIFNRSSANYPQGYTVGWADNTTHFVNTAGGGSLLYVVEDHYSLASYYWRGGLSLVVATKVTDALLNVNLAWHCSAEALYITLLSAEADADLHGPANLASGINPKMVSEWPDNWKRRSGIVAMDFAGDSQYQGDRLIDKIIQMNFD